MVKITAELLRSKGACRYQVKKFRALFGDDVEPTRELCIAHAQDFDWDWAAEHLLSAPAREAYYEAVAPALKVNDEAVASAREAYYEALAAAREAYYEALAAAWFDVWAGEHQ